MYKARSQSVANPNHEGVFGWITGMQGDYLIKQKYAVFLDGVGFFPHAGYMFTFISNFVKADFPT